MRFVLFFRVKSPIRIPINYQYPLMAWVYQCLAKADSDFATFLHTEGYAAGVPEEQVGKRFKFFTFSSLQLPHGAWRVEGSELVLKPCQGIKLSLSFYLEKGAETFIMGLFRDQLLRFRGTNAELQVEQVSVQPVEITEGPVRLRTLSPLIVSRMPDPNKGERYPQYLSPSEANYAGYFLQSLSNRYHTALTIKQEALPSNDLPIEFRLLGEPRKKAITIKEGRQDQSRVIGYEFEFELTAPPAMVEFGLLAGFGEKNSMGFGCCGVVSKNNR